MYLYDNSTLSKTGNHGDTRFGWLLSNVLLFIFNFGTVQWKQNFQQANGYSILVKAQRFIGFDSSKFQRQSNLNKYIFVSNNNFVAPQSPYYPT